jgi:hypothetical protein
MATIVSVRAAAPASPAAAPVSTAPATDPTVVRAYRDYLVPLIATWRARGARVGVFGIGPHTPDLLAIVPELESPAPVVYLDSNASAGATYRGRPVLPLTAVEEHADVVVCSSYTRETEQLRLLDAYDVKAYLSHPPQFSAGQPPQFLHMPTFGYPVVVPPAPGEHCEALALAFEQHRPDFEAALRPLLPFFSELDDIPNQQVDAIHPYWHNGYFGADDARTAYAMVRAHRPRRILEIGCGNSTKFMRLAITRNGGGTEIISIDPSPRAGLDGLSDRIVCQPLQRVPIETFDVLEAGDILFMDGTHQVVYGSDSVFFYLRVLPRLRQGVRVQIHDITLPLEYPDTYVERFYAEQYVLAALLLGGDNWRATHLLLTVIRSRAVLAEVVLVHEEIRRRGGVGRDRAHGDVHPREKLQDARVFDRLERIRSPRERSVIRDEHRRHFLRGDLAGPERLDDHQAGVRLVRVRHFLFAHRTRHRDITMEVVGVRRTHAAHRKARLRQRGRALAVRVDDAAARGECAIQLEVRRRIG